MYFSVWLDTPKAEPEAKVSAGAKSRPTAKPKGKKQPVAEAVSSE
jgi:hypothetical protein